MLVVLLGVAALVVDIGYAYYAKRSLQASADAAALAGAQELPDPTEASATALEYSGRPYAKNAKDNLPVVDTTVTTKCVSMAPCNPVNAIVVKQTTLMPTKFAGLLGFDTFTIRAQATACSPCGARPLDIMLVLDRTGSMCADHSGLNDPSCADLNNAKKGLRDFIAYMDPALDKIGLAVLPPAATMALRCALPVQGNYDLASAPYVIAPLTQDYKTGNALNESSQLVSTVNCLRAGSSTAYATAIDKAQTELNTNGRADAQDVIVFFSDGAANYGPLYYGNGSAYRTQPCHQGITSAGAAKARKTIIYSIGYDLDALNGGANRCQSYTGALESPSITAYSTLSQIASSPETFYNQPSPGELGTIYTQIAADLSGARLIDDAIK
jgi:hypothetical protein